MGLNRSRHLHELLVLGVLSREIEMANHSEGKNRGSTKVDREKWLGNWQKSVLQPS